MSQIAQPPGQLWMTGDGRALQVISGPYTIGACRVNGTLGNTEVPTKHVKKSPHTELDRTALDSGYSLSFSMKNPAYLAKSLTSLSGIRVVTGIYGARNPSGKSSHAHAPYPPTRKEGVRAMILLLDSSFSEMMLNIFAKTYSFACVSRSGRASMASLSFDGQLEFFSVPDAYR